MSTYSYKGMRTVQLPSLKNKKKKKKKKFRYLEMQAKPWLAILNRRSETWSGSKRDYERIQNALKRWFMVYVSKTKDEGKGFRKDSLDEMMENHCECLEFLEDKFPGFIILPRFTTFSSTTTTSHQPRSPQSSVKILLSRLRIEVHRAVLRTMDLMSVRLLIFHSLSQTHTPTLEHRYDGNRKCTNSHATLQRWRCIVHVRSRYR